MMNRYEMIDEIVKVEGSSLCEKERKELYATRYERYFDYSTIELEDLACSLDIDITGDETI